MDWLLERFQHADPALTAFVYGGRATSYAELSSTIKRFGESLGKVGVKPGQTVAVLADFAPDVFAMIMALALKHCIMVPMTRSSVIEDSEALAISGCDHMLSFAPDGLSWTLEPRWISASTALMDEFRATGRAGLVLFSSGSTGKPKGILHDLERVATKFIKPRSPVVAIPFLMFDHFGGFNTILAITSSLGTVVSVAERSVARICGAIQQYRVSLLPTTPSFLNLLMAARAHEAYDLSSLRRITYGTEVMPQATLDRLARALPDVVLQQTYGLSEVGVLASKSRDDGSLWMRIGGEGFQTKVVDGILWIKSEYSMVGYLNAPSNFDAEGWFNTQDKVEVDGEYFRILGRVTDLINVGGQKVYPAEIEEVIMTLPNIVDVAVFAESNALLGQIIVARVALAEPESVDSVKSRIRVACKASLAAYKVPAKVVIATDAIYTARYKKSRQATPPPRK